MVETNGGDALAKAMGDEIEFWRRKRGMSREELGSVLGKSKNTIGRYERGETQPDVNETWAIADALGVPLSQLISRVEDALKTDHSETLAARLEQEGYALAAENGALEPDDQPSHDEPA